MASVRIEWNMPGFRALRTDPAVVADLRRRAENIAAACGEGYIAEANPAPRRRARAAVITATGKAIRDNAENNTLLRNLGRGR